MPFKKCNPGCGACCTSISDDFNVADSTTLSGDWSEESGDFRTQSSKLECTSAGVAVWDTTWGTTYYDVSAKVTGGTGDVIGLTSFYSNTSNYYWMQLEWQSSTEVDLSLWKRVGGSNTQLGSTKTFHVLAGDELVIHLCTSANGQAGQTVSAYVEYYYAGTFVSAQDNSLSGPGKGGVIGSTITTSYPTWDDFSITSTTDGESGCPGCRKTCSPCWHGWPSFTIDVANFTHCLFTTPSQCSNWNGSYAMDFEGISGGGYCEWTAELPAVTCSSVLGTAMSLEVGTGFTRVKMGVGGSGQTIFQDSSSNITSLHGPSTPTTTTGSTIEIEDNPGVTYYHCRVTAQTDTDGDQLGIVFAYQDANNYLEFLTTFHSTLASRVHQIWQTVGGTRTKIAEGPAGGAILDSGVILEASIIIDSDDIVTLHGYTSGGLDPFLYVNNGSGLTGGSAGVITGTVTGTISFSNFSIFAYDCEALDGRVPAKSVNGNCGFSGTPSVTVNASSNGDAA